jgi:polyisoprenoid-binding protein YceI
MVKTLIQVLLISLLASHASAEHVAGHLVQQSTEKWKANGAKSHLYFAPSFEELPINGAFKRFTVGVIADQKQPQSLNVQVQIASADLGSSDLNEAIQMVDWFDSETFAGASFASEDIAMGQAENQFIATGLLQLKGMKKTIEVPFSWQASNQNNISMVGELALGRHDFAIGTGEWASGDQIGLAVRVWFELVLEIADD